MALTIAQSALLSNDVLQAGVLELFVRDDPILERLPFVTIVGNSLKYNIESEEATAKFYEVGDTWVEDIGQVSQANANLKILGGDADVDNFLVQTRSNVNDLKAEALATKIKAVKKQFMESFYYGYDGAVTGGLTGKEFNGLHMLISDTGTNTTVAPAAGTRLSYNVRAIGKADADPEGLTTVLLEEAVDKVTGFKPELMVMSKLMRRVYNVFLVAAGGITYEDRANKRVQTILGIPVAPSAYVSDNENCNHQYSADTDMDFGFEFNPATHAKVGDASTSIFILAFDPKACCGVQNGAMTTVPLGDLETKDASRWRIKWYVSMMLQNILSCSKVTGIDPATAVA